LSAGGDGADSSSALDIEDEVFYEDGEEDGEEDDEEDEEDEDEMGDVPSAAVKLEAFLLENYDQDATTAAAMATSLEDEEAKWSWPGLDDVV
jgi:hypothetical protein